MKKFAWLVLAVCFSVPAAAQIADTVRIMHYNLLQYGSNNCMPLQTKNTYLTTILEHARPDILTLNEVNPNTAVVNNLRATCQAVNPAYATAPYANSTGSPIVNVVLYDQDVFGLVNHSAITGNVRDIDVVHLYHKPSSDLNDSTHLYLIVAHLKAGNDYAPDRAEAAADIAAWLAQHPEASNYILCGDLNLYASNEPAWQSFVGGANARFIDPTGQPSGWVGPAFAALHTQSPSDGSTNACATEGGMDNRFDFTLISPSVQLGNRNVYYLPATCRAYGNDGVSYNQPLNCNATTSVPANVCTALRNVSDHLPVVIDLAVGNPAFVAAPEPVLPTARILTNPVADELRVAFTESNLVWAIADPQGRILARGTTDAMHEIRLSVAELAPGPYFLLVQNPKGTTFSAVFAKI